MGAPKLSHNGWRNQKLQKCFIVLVPANGLGRDGGAVVVRVADGRVPLVRDGDDDKDRCAQDDVGRRVDEEGEGVAVPVEVQVERTHNAVVQHGEEDQDGVDDCEHHLQVVVGSVTRC